MEEFTWPPPAEQFPFRERSNRNLQIAISRAIDQWISIGPLHALISAYAEFLAGTVTTREFEMPEHDFRAGFARGTAITMAEIKSNEGLLTTDNSVVVCENDYYVRRIWLNDEHPIETCGVPICHLRQAICSHPTEPDTFYIADSSRIYRWERGGSPSVVLAGGNNESASKNAVGEHARFKEITGLAAVGKTLYVCDFRQLRAVDTETASVSTAFDFGWYCGGIISCVRYRPSKSILYITQRLSTSDLARFDIESGEMTYPKLSRRLNSLSAIDCTASGILIVSSEVSDCLYAIDPINGEVERIAGTKVMGDIDGDALIEAKFAGALRLCVDEANQCCWIVGTGTTSIRQLTLNPALFGFN